MRQIHNFNGTLVIGTYLKVKKLIPKEKNTLKRNC